jgi:hypothetical protein
MGFCRDKYAIIIDCAMQKSLLLGCRNNYGTDQQVSYNFKAIVI